MFLGEAEIHRQVRGQSPGGVGRHGSMPSWTRLALEGEWTGFVNGVSGWSKRERSRKPRLSPEQLHAVVSNHRDGKDLGQS